MVLKIQNKMRNKTTDNPLSLFFSEKEGKFIQISFKSIASVPESTRMGDLGLFVAFRMSATLKSNKSFLESKD